MIEFIFLWSHWTEQHIEKHGVAPDEAEFVVVHSSPPFPMSAGADKRVAWGQTRLGRFLQVIFVPVALERVTQEEYERLHLYQRLALDSGSPAVRIIHGRDLTGPEIRRLRRRRRGAS